MELRQIDNIPKCCGSCRSFGTNCGAWCGYHKLATFAMGVCDDYEIKDEYSHLISVEAGVEIDENWDDSPGDWDTDY